MDSHKTDDAERGEASPPGAQAHGQDGTPREIDPAVASSVVADEDVPLDESTAPSQAESDRGGSALKKKAHKNNVRKIRMEKMMSKAELARRAGMSTLTIDRVERGLPCRMDTKRKILEALGLKPSDRVLVFGEDD
jgi:DNA-binding XRE family transcriptional regulator